MSIITFFVNQSLDSPTGIGRYFPIAKNLVKLGHRVNILALHHDFSSLKEKNFIKEGVNVYYVGQMQVLKKGDKKIYLSRNKLIKTVLSSTFNMCLKGLKLKSDILYVSKPQPINGTAAFINKILKGKKLFVDCDDYEAKSNRFSSFMDKYAFVFFENNLPKIADKVTIHNNFLIEKYKNLGINKKKIFYLPNGVDLDRFKKINKKLILNIKNKFKLKNKKIILYFGSLSLKSGHSVDLLIKAFEIVNKKIKNSVLLLVGGGEDIDLLKEKAKNLNSVIFVGRVNQEEIPSYIKISDVTVDPVYDTLPNKCRSPLKMIESMVMGVPVITGDVGDRKIIADNGKAAIIVKAGDEKLLASSIIEILKNKKLSKRLSKHGLQIVKKYDWKKLTFTLNKIISS
ncbi:MAG: glycosyltransferase family 4 protein [Nanoarchaeota archaeon]